jgi:hypothetical protein
MHVASHDESAEPLEQVVPDHKALVILEDLPQCIALDVV